MINLLGSLTPNAKVTPETGSGASFVTVNSILSSSPPTAGLPVISRVTDKCASGTGVSVGIGVAVGMCVGVGPISPWSPLGPCGPISPWSPLGPCGPISPWSPLGPCGPISPWSPLGPCGPISPWSPSGPCGPTSPWSPLGPCGPISPWSPLGPGTEYSCAICLTSCSVNPPEHARQMSMTSSPKARMSFIWEWSAQGWLGTSWLRPTIWCGWRTHCRASGLDPSSRCDLPGAQCARVTCRGLRGSESHLHSRPPGTKTAFRVIQERRHRPASQLHRTDNPILQQFDRGSSILVGI